MTERAPGHTVEVLQAVECCLSAWKLRVYVTWNIGLIPTCVDGAAATLYSAFAPNLARQEFSFEAQR